MLFIGGEKVYEEIGCSYCEEYVVVKINSDAHKACLCESCFHDLTDENRKKVLKK
jgi:formylmethanofuran dehydrogenase subunit E